MFKTHPHSLFIRLEPSKLFHTVWFLKIHQNCVKNVKTIWNALQVIYDFLGLVQHSSILFRLYLKVSCLVQDSPRLFKTYLNLFQTDSLLSQTCTKLAKIGQPRLWFIKTWLKLSRTFKLLRTCLRHFKILPGTFKTF